MSLFELKSKQGVGLFLLGSALSYSCAQKEFQGGVRSKRPLVYSSEATPLPVLTEDQVAAVPLGQAADILMGRFPAAELREETFRFRLATKGAETSFVLKDIHKNQRNVFRQLTRPSKTESYTQGYPPSRVQDVFDQEARKGMVDILVVIDNSISMREEQTNLSDKMQELVVSIAKSDWQIGVITTSARLENDTPQCAMNLIRAREADATARFRNAIMAGTSGDSNEQGILQAVVGLSCPSNPWLRPGASVAVLIVSDEDNCSAEGEDCPDSPANKESYLIRYVEEQLGREIGKNAGFYGIFSPPTAPCFAASNIGHQYQRLVDYKAQGAMNWGNICDPSYKSTLNRISDNIATLLSSEFELKMPPLEGTLKLSLRLADGSERTIDPEAYSLEGMTVQFEAGKEPPDGVQLVADYLVAGVPEFSQLTLQEDVAPETLEVRIDGELLPREDYELSGRTLLFASQPPPKAELTIDYRLAQDLMKVYQLSHVPLDQSLSITIDGQETQAYAWDAARRQISFSSPPRDGAEIIVSSKLRVGPQLSYALPLGEGSSQIQIFDGEWPIPFEQSDASFTIPAAVHKEGKELVIRYQMPDSAQRKFDLAHAPLPQSLRIESGDLACQWGKELQIEGSTLLTECGVERTQEFVLAYQYYERRASFSLEGVASPDEGRWQVQVNGIATSDFRRTGQTIELNFEVAPTAIIGVQYVLPEKKSGLAKNAIEFREEIEN